jgi:hypothetical protein
MRRGSVNEGPDRIPARRYIDKKEGVRHVWVGAGVAWMPEKRVPDRDLMTVNTDDSSSGRWAQIEAWRADENPVRQSRIERGYQGSLTDRGR